jgi:hypothetical protein
MALKKAGLGGALSFGSATLQMMSNAEAQADKIIADYLRVCLSETFICSYSCNSDIEPAHKSPPICLKLRPPESSRRAQRKGSGSL